MMGFSSATVDRRAFLRAGVLGAGGLALPQLLQARATASESAALDTSCILVWLNGGPSHLETYDMKPDAPAEYRGQFGPAATNVVGMQVCELLPRHARIADKFSLIRSVAHGFSAHAGGVQQVLTGRRPLAVEKEEPDYPDVGSIVKRVRSESRPELPPYVTMPFRFESGGPAYLGKQYEPFVVPASPNAPRFEIPDLSLTGAGAARLDERLALLDGFDDVRRGVDRNGVMAATDHYRREAVSLLTGDAARKAFDIAQESQKLRDRYGRTRVGQSLLLARRLAEAGVGLVTVMAGSFDTPNGSSNWDDHAIAWNIFEQMKLRLPVYDQALTALIEDVYDRGLDKRILVVALGEFGRTPKISLGSGGRPGREHYPNAMSILVSGGGLRMGQVIGATDARGERPRERPLRPTDFLATVYAHLGIDPKNEFRDFTGRPLPILPDGEPIAEL
jgi:hypothetical protein